MKQYQKPIAETFVLFNVDIMANSVEGNIGEWDKQDSEMRAAECEQGGMYTI